MRGQRGPPPGKRLSDDIHRRNFATRNRDATLNLAQLPIERRRLLDRHLLPRQGVGSPRLPLAHSRPRLFNAPRGCGPLSIMLLPTTAAQPTNESAYDICTHARILTLPVRQKTERIL